MQNEPSAAKNKQSINGTARLAKEKMQAAVNSEKEMKRLQRQLDKYPQYLTKSKKDLAQELNMFKNRLKLI